MNLNKRLINAKRIVIKIGSALLLNKSGQINNSWIESLAHDLQALCKNGQQIILVCSGSVALGRKILMPGSYKLALPEQQAAAAVGQIQLIHAYQEVLPSHGIKIAQLLLSLDDSEDRKRYINASNTLNTLLNLNIVPIINENDSVATSELRVGDNDRLAARVAQMVMADILVFFSDVDGLYDADPTKYREAKHIPVVKEINSDIESLAGNSSSKVGTGGMKTKIAAAKIATESGCNLVITNGFCDKPISTLLAGGKSTWFLANVTPSSARRNWLQHQLEPKGKVFVDDGAVKALTMGKSLLAAGITKVQSEFNKGDAVVICDKDQQILAKGLVSYPAFEIKKILGKHSSSIESTLGYSNGTAIIHRNNMVLIGVEK